MGRKLDQTLAVLNGLVGDYLDRTGNGLGFEMAFYREGRPLTLDAHSVAAAYPQATARIAVLAHGLMCTEDVFRDAEGLDYGERLYKDLGFTPFHLRYNSGLPIADNGARLHALLEQLTVLYPQPIEEILLLGYSMGGLVVRSACHYAGLAKSPWLSLVRRAFYVGTPHDGAPAERVGRKIAKVLEAIPDPYTRLFADISNLRSAGVKDLGDAPLRSEDRGRARLRDAEHPVPLLPSIRHHLIAGSLDLDPRIAWLFGESDTVVPLGGATSGGKPGAEGTPPLDRIAVIPGCTHVALAHDARVYERIKRYCEEGL